MIQKRPVVSGLLALFPALVIAGSAACVAQEADASREAVAETSAESWVSGARRRAQRDREARRAAPYRGTGRARVFGTEGALTVELHPEGAFRIQVDGPLGTTRAGDGTRVWETDWTGLANELVFGERERAELLAAVLSGRWAEDDEAFLAESLPASEGDAPAMTLRARGGRTRARVELDGELRVRSVGFGGGTWHLEDHRDALGFDFPFRLRLVERGGAEHVFQLEGLARAELDPSDFAPPASPPADHRFDAELRADVEARRAKTGHVLVRPRVDGRDLGWFIMDSGAGGSCLTPGTAAELGLEAIGVVTASGVGGEVEAAVLRGGELTVGQLILEQPTWVELDLAFLEPIFGVPVAGILGYDVFARSIVAIDVTTPRVSVHAPREFSLPDGAAWGRLYLEDHQPCIEAGLEGDRRGAFKIDTGATDNVVVHHAAVQRWGLLDERETGVAVSGGVGGFVQVAAGQLAWFELGGRRFERIDATFEREPGRMMQSGYIVGTIGGGLLSPFTLVLDYPERRAALVPRP